MSQETETERKEVMRALSVFGTIILVILFGLFLSVLWTLHLMPLLSPPPGEELSGIAAVMAMASWSLLVIPLSPLCGCNLISTRTD